MVRDHLPAFLCLSAVVTIARSKEAGWLKSRQRIPVGGGYQNFIDNAKNLGKI
jgi:hypothetical protein